MRAIAGLLLAVAALTGCDTPPASQSFSIAESSRPPATAPAPAPTPASLNIADYMYGPPPHSRIDPRMRCRFDCPIYPASLPPPVR